MGDERVQLGPQASYQWLHDPKHLLFVLARYKHAARLMGNVDTVLEIGCGEGIGVPFLSLGRRYIGIDPDMDAVDIAAEHDRPGCAFSYHSLESLEPAVRAEAVVALDVIEHVAVHQRPSWIARLAEHLPPHGVCVIGTPNATASHYQSEASRAGHADLLDANELMCLLAPRFFKYQMFGMNDEVLHTGFLGMAHYLIGVGLCPR